MPATVTHAFFAKDVYDILPTTISDKLDLGRCKMFGQSVDSLLFYNLFSILPGKNIRKFSFTFHETQSQEFFINLLHYIKENKIQDSDTYSFLMGFICHYVLDSTIHPFVYYKTGFFQKGKPETYKYNNVHLFMEVFLDNDMIRRREKTNPYKYSISKNCFDTRPFSTELNHTIQYSFVHTFYQKNMDKIYYKSLKQMKMAMTLFRRDPYGIKKFFYKLADTVTPRSCFRFEAISYHYPLEDRFNFLNSNHSLWRNPALYKKTSKESFVDLYVDAIKKAKTIICASFDYLDGKEIDLEKIFPDISYLHGLECQPKKELKFFEF